MISIFVEGHVEPTLLYARTHTNTQTQAHAYHLQENDENRRSQTLKILQKEQSNLKMALLMEFLFHNSLYGTFFFSLIKIHLVLIIKLGRHNGKSSNDFFFYSLHMFIIDFIFKLSSFLSNKCCMYSQSARAEFCV